MNSYVGYKLQPQVGFFIGNKTETRLTDCRLVLRTPTGLAANAGVIDVAIDARQQMQITIAVVCDGPFTEQPDIDFDATIGGSGAASRTRRI